MSAGSTNLNFSDGNTDSSGKDISFIFSPTWADGDTVSLSISVPDTTAPTVVSGGYSPADGATNVAVDANLSLTFNETVKKGSGDITIRRTSDNTDITISVTSGQVTVGGTDNKVVTINPTADLANDTAYHVRIPSGAIQDSADNNYGGISDATIWNFTTIAAAQPLADDDDDDAANAPPAYQEASYQFELRENADGRRRAVPLGAVEAEDPDGDAVTYELASGGGGGRFAVGPSDGAVSYVGPGEDYETEPNEYALTVLARDPQGAEAQVQVVVEVTNVNEAPAAEDDEASTTEDEPVVIDVLANDTDPDARDTLRIVSVSAPAHGTARVATGGVAYTPEADYHGPDRFTYTIADGNGLTAEAAVMVTVTPVNDAPRAVGAIPNQTLDEGGSASEVDVSPYFEDIDGDALTYRASAADGDVVVASAAGGGRAGVGRCGGRATRGRWTRGASTERGFGAAGC